MGELEEGDKGGEGECWGWICAVRPGRLLVMDLREAEKKLGQVRIDLGRGDDGSYGLGVDEGADEAQGRDEGLVESEYGVVEIWESGNGGHERKSRTR